MRWILDSDPCFESSGSLAVGVNQSLREVEAVEVTGSQLVTFDTFSQLGRTHMDHIKVPEPWVVMKCIFLHIVAPVASPSSRASGRVSAEF